MNKNISLLLVSLTALTILLLPRAGWAISCDAPVYNPSQFVAASTLSGNRNSSVETIQLGKVNQFNCSGNYKAPTQEMLRVSSIQLHPNLIAAGFTSHFLMDFFINTPLLPQGDCLTGWGLGWCSPYVGTSGSFSTAMMGIIAKITRPAGGRGYSLAAGDTLITIQLERRSGTNWIVDSQAPVFTFKLAGAVNSPYTCNITTYDQTVRLPSVSLADIQAAPTGRYSGATKPFALHLGCKPDTRVKAKFEGTLLTGVLTQDALENAEADNPNVGVQILFNGNPVKFGEEFIAVTSATANQDLNFNAYYYKTGSVAAGKVRALTTFSLTYD